jgi:enoyl-CoA hydratase/carnithine racemase
MTAPATQGEAGAEPAVRVERRGAALWLYLNRPSALNGISPEIVGGLEDGLDQAARDDDVRVVVLAASGRVFCAGADLKYVLDIAAPGGATDDAARLHDEFTSQVGETFSRIESFPKPVVAAVHGLAVAGGLELVLCADVVVAAESARFGDAHANYGLLPGAGGSARLPRRVGLATAKYLMFTGQAVSARELLHTDLVTKVVDDDDLEPEVGRLVDQLAGKSPLGLRVMKDLANAAFETPLSTGLRQEADDVRRHTGSADFVEGIRAFNEKRLPKFTGR